MIHAKKRIRYTREDIAFNVISYSVITLLILVCLYPIWYVACASITDPTIVAAAKGILLWPQGLTFDAYAEVFQDAEIWSGYANTLLYTVVGTILNVVLTAMVAYALAHRDLLFKKPLTLFITFTMFFNGGMLPTYPVIRNMDLLDTRLPALLARMVSVFNFMVMRTQFESVPEALEESAKLDGANYWTIFTRIILPVSGATLAVMVLFYGVTHWNSWFNEMLYMPNDRTKWPLALITREIIVASSAAAVSEGGVMTQEKADAIKYATIMVSTLPILCLYPFLQKYFVKGVMVGSVKG